jgi:3-dehydroquinate synthase
MSARRIDIGIPGAAAYSVFVGRGLLGSLGPRVAALAPSRKAVVITDDNVGALHLEGLLASLALAGVEAHALTIPAGEASKSIEVAAELWQAMSMCGIGRDGVVVALGGGVVGDIAGFVASTWMRGIPCIQAPTSLLAMVDSSVGGKTGVNSPAGKNLIGTIAQPALVVCDLDVLATLPDDQWPNGFAEIAKSAVIDSEGFFTWLGENAEGLVRHEPEILLEAVFRSLRFKAGVIVNDVSERGLRECLNYGHTFGHAIEAALGYGAVGHGVAVAEGMRFAVRLAMEAAGAPESFAQRQDALLDSLGLASSIAALSADVLFEQMRCDKKARQGHLRFVLASAPGVWRTMSVDDDLAKIYLIYWEQARDGLNFGRSSEAGHDEGEGEG